MGGKVAKSLSGRQRSGNWQGGGHNYVLEEGGEKKHR